MASVISASTTSATALNLSGDTSGVLQIATGATPTTAVTVDASQNLLVGTTSANGYSGAGTGVFSAKVYAGANSISTGALGSSTDMMVVTDGDNPQYVLYATNATGGASNRCWRMISRTAGTFQIQTLNDATTSETTQINLTQSGVLSFNSGYGSAAPAYGCRAWVSFNGTGTIAIRESGNVSSITDVGVGSYRINFTNAMPDINYAFAGNGQGSSSGSLGCNTIPFTSNAPASLVDPTTTSVNFTTWLFNYSATFDPRFVTAAIFR